MISKKQEFVAELFRIFGLSMMTPLAKEYFRFSNIRLADLSVQYIIYLVLSGWLAYTGMLIIQAGADIIGENEK